MFTCSASSWIVFIITRGTGCLGGSCRWLLAFFIAACDTIGGFGFRYKFFFIFFGDKNAIF